MLELFRLCKVGLALFGYPNSRYINHTARTERGNLVTLLQGSVARAYQGSRVTQNYLLHLKRPRIEDGDLFLF
jgi:hypothetical protein